MIIKGKTMFSLVKKSSYISIFIINIFNNFNGFIGMTIVNIVDSDMKIKVFRINT